MTNDSLPTPEVKKSRRWLLPSLIWVVPLAAALIGLSLAINAVMKAGPTIYLTFASADGIEPGKTKIRFKSVEIGEVKSVILSPDRKNVIVQVELVKEAESFAVEDSRFWVVRPRFNSGNVSGLGTLLSGPYISVDGGVSDKRATEFVGLEEPPLVHSGTPGRRYLLQTTDAGSLDANSPILFHRIVVGQVENISLDPNGRMISMSIWINAPYDKYVTQNTRFWQASGVDVRLDAAGFRVSTESLTTILLGGISFGIPDGASDSPLAEQNTVFSLASSQDEAFRKPDGESVEAVMFFAQTVRGLSVGAPLDFRGIELGNVRSISMVFDKPSRTFVVRVGAEIFPERLNEAGFSTPFAERTPEWRRNVATTLVKHGLRAQLRSGSLLTGQLYVALDFFPNADPVEIDFKADPVVLPTVPGNLEEIQQQVVQILAKVNQVPFDELGQSLQKTLVALEGTLKNVERLSNNVDRDLTPELRKTLIETRKALEMLQVGIAPDSPVQQDMRQSIQSITEASRSLKALTDSLERNPESLVRGRREGAGR